MNSQMLGNDNTMEPCPFQDELPVEIRIHVYEYVLFENGNFFSLEDDEGRSIVTLFPKLKSPPKRTRLLHEAGEQHDAGEGHKGNGNGNGTIMSLLLTSKQIYQECACHLYSSSFFRLRGIQSTIHFINTVHPAHLALVRSLKLVWDDQGWTSAPEFDTPTLRSAWPSLCDALATRFPSLRNLYVAVGVPSNEAHVEALYLGALRAVGHVRNFKVCQPVGFLVRFEGLDDHDHTSAAAAAAAACGEQAPFTLCRHTAGEVCPSRKEVMRAEWHGASRPSTPELGVQQ